jgi:hypothetical protein
MDGQERDRIAAFLEDEVSAGASSEELAALVAATFRGIEQVLVSIVGQRGVTALYKRTLHLARPTRPWLPAAAEEGGGESEIDLAALATALAKQTSAQAAAAGSQMLDGFLTLLITLIGESLAERLLRPVWATFFSGRSARAMKS